MTVQPSVQICGEEWQLKKAKSILNIKEARKMIREKKKQFSPSISVPFVWWSHEHMIPYLKQGNVLKTCLDSCGRALQEGTSVPNNRQQYASREKWWKRKSLQVFMLCYTHHREWRQLLSFNLHLFCWCWFQSQLSNWCWASSLPDSSACCFFFFPWKCWHSELRPGEVHQFRRWELTPLCCQLSRVPGSSVAGGHGSGAR